MDPISTRPAADGGMDVTIHLTPTQAAALGHDAVQLADWLHSALWAMAVLRTGQDQDGRPYRPTWFDSIVALDHRLVPRIEGVRDAVIRAHADGGGSVGDLALAMDVPRSTAQYRRDVLRRSAPSIWESWARGDSQR